MLGRHSNREIGRKMSVAELKTVYPLDNTVDGKYRDAVQRPLVGPGSPYHFSPMAKIMQTPMVRARA